MAITAKFFVYIHVWWSTKKILENFLKILFSLQHNINIIVKFFLLMFTYDGLQKFFLKLYLDYNADIYYCVIFFCQYVHMMYWY